MNRCAQVLADTCIGKVANLLKQSKPINIDRLTFNSSLKYLIINDPNISIEISGPSSFDVFESHAGLIQPNGPAISEARISDFLLGSTRVRKQYDAVLRMRNDNVPSAWLVVSAYYCAYFACIELCKLINRTSISFEEDEISSLRIKSVGSNHASFFDSGQTNFIGVEKAGKLIFSAIGSKPHAAAWENALHAIRSVLSTKGWTEANQYISILMNPDYSPSRIRNTWNYRRTDFFGHIGEKKAREFRSLVGNHDGATAWLRRTNGRTEPLDPCIVAVLCETLSSAVTNAGQRAGDLLRQNAKTQL